MTNIHYAGVGPRKDVPMPILDQMHMIGTMLGSRGFTLRSGKAAGSDTAFETGARAVSGPMILRIGTLDRLWVEHAKLFHPNWAAVEAQGDNVVALMARNSGVMCGDNLNDPVNFVVTWTPGAAIVGGTGQALRIAAAYGIPVFNLARPGDDAALWAHVAGL